MRGMETPDGDRPVAIRLTGLVRRFGRIVALNGLEMAVPRGAVYGFIGNNGAGKTTAIHTLLGLIPATAGEVDVLGLNARSQGQAIRRRVGFFPERDEPYEWMRVGLLIRLGRYTFDDWDSDLAEQLRQRFDLDPRKRIKELSKGLAAKAKLVVALSHRPDLLVLDEPTSGLDPASRYDLLDTIGEQSAEHGVTTLFSSHNLDEVERIATHVGVIHRGRMALEAPFAEIVERFGLIEGVDTRLEPPPELRPLILAAMRLGGEPVWLVNPRDAPAVDAYCRDHPGATVRPATLPELFRLLTMNDAPAPAVAAV